MTDKVVFEFPVLWHEWECDSKAWVMERQDGTRYLRMTNHGGAYEAKIEELNQRIAEYEKTLAQTREAISMLTGNT